MKSPYVTALRAQLVDAAAREHVPVTVRMRWLRPVAIAAAIVIAAVLGIRALDLGTTEHEATPAKPQRLSGRPLFGGTLEPGVRYATRALRPQMSLVVGDPDWLAQGTEDSDLLVLEWRKDGLEVPAALSFERVGRVTDPQTGRAVAAPQDFLSWLRRHPDVRAGRIGTTTVAGLPARYLDTTISFKRPAHHDPGCEQLMQALLADPSARPPCTKLAPGLGFPDGWRTRWIVVPVGDETLTIMIEAYGKQTFDRVEPVAQRVIDSLRVR